MSLILRLVWLFLTQIRSRRTDDLFGVSRIHCIALPNDLDLNFHVNNGRLMTFIDFGRLAWLHRTGALQFAMRRKHIPIVGDVSARFLKPLKAFERFTIETRLLRWNAKWGYFEHRILKRNGQVVLVMADRGMFWRRSSGAMPMAEVVAGLTYGNPQPPPLPEWVQIWSQSLDMAKHGFVAEPTNVPTTPHASDERLTLEDNQEASLTPCVL
jgi:acyl-CoA thioesterase FadM